MSETLKVVLQHWTDKEDFQGDFGTLDLPFDLEGVCLVLDAEIQRLRDELERYEEQQQIFASITPELHERIQKALGESDE